MNNKSASDLKGAGSASVLAKERPGAQEYGAIITTLQSRFEILELLRQQEEASIFLARDRRPAVTGPNFINLKILSEQAALDRKKLELFYLESQAAARLSHKNIIKTYEPEQVGNIHFCVIETGRGHQTLREMLDLRAWLDVEFASSIAHQIARALDYARVQGVLHLRLRPESILVDSNGATIVTDFGIGSEDDLMWARLKRSQSMPAIYSSPEQGSDQDADARSDLYSLGVMLYEMLTDRVPFNYQSADVIRHRRKNQTPEPPDIFRSDLPPSLSETTMSLLEKDPLKRPQMYALLQLLSGAAIQAPGPLVTIEDPWEELQSDFDTAPLIEDDQQHSIVKEPEEQVETEGDNLIEPLFDFDFYDDKSDASASEGNFAPALEDKFAPVEPVAQQLQEKGIPARLNEAARTDELSLALPQIQPEPLAPSLPIAAQAVREKYEPPTITVIDPPAHDFFGQPQQLAGSASEPERGSPGQAERSSNIGAKAKLFVVLFIVIGAAAVILLQPANRLKLFRLRAAPDSTVEHAAKDDSPGEPAASRSAEPAPGDTEQPADPKAENDSAAAKKDAGSKFNNAQPSGAVAERKSSSATRYVKTNQAARRAPRKLRSYRAWPPAKRFRVRLHRN